MLPNLMKTECRALYWTTVHRQSGWAIDIFNARNRREKFTLLYGGKTPTLQNFIFKKEVTKMDEMNNMNETTVMENENSVEVVPEENVQMIENEETSGINPKLVLGAAVIAGAAIVGGIKHLKSKKNKPANDKPKTKKIHLRAPWTITEETVPEKTEDADKEVVEEVVEELSDEEE